MASFCELDNGPPGVLSSWATVSLSWGTVLYKVAGVEVGLSLCEGSAWKITERSLSIVLVRCVTEDGMDL